MIQVDTTLTKLEKLYDRKLQTSIKAFDFSTNLDIVCGFPKKYFWVKSNVENLISVGYQIRPQGDENFRKNNKRTPTAIRETRVDQKQKSQQGKKG